MSVHKPTARSNVNAGDVVVTDVDNDTSVLTTTTASSQDVAGVCAETITSGNPVIVESDGDFVTVNVAAGTARGQWLVTHTVVGQAIGVDLWRKGAFGKALSNIGTPAAGQCYATVSIGWQENEHLHMVPGTTAETTHHGRALSADVDSLPASSVLHMTDFSATGTASGEVVAMAVNSGIDPILQNTGTFVTPSQTEYAARFPSGGAWTDGIDAQTIFVADDDAIYIGAVATFSQLEVLLTTPANVDAQPTFHYYNTALAWVEFFPYDGTAGFRQDGTIEWKSGNFTNWKSDYDPGAADGSAGYYIKITRTRNTMATTPVPTTIKTLEPTPFGWNSTGDLSVNDIAIAGTLTAAIAALTPTLNNNTGVLIAAGKAVYMATTGSLEIALASNAAVGTALVRGVTSASIANGASGAVVFVGPVVTGTWAGGERGFPIYLSTAGDMTVSRPAAEAIISIIGFVLDTDTIYVNPTMDYIYG